jgi:hypothetical protein
VQTEHIGSLQIIDVGNMSVRELVPFNGHCLAYSCQWILNIKANKKYMVKSLDTLASFRIQQEHVNRNAVNPDLANSFLLHLHGIQTRSRNDLLHINPNTYLHTLDTYAQQQANFVVIDMVGTYNTPPAHGDNAWAHVIALKLNQSSTGGYLNWSYPCAMFDPNIGQGMYNNHKDLADDLNALLYEYTQVFGPYTQIDSYLVKYSSGEVD